MGSFEAIRTALVVIDMQQGLFAAAGSDSFVAERAGLIVANTKLLAEAMRAAGGTVVMVKVARPDICGKAAVPNDPIAIGSPGAEFVAELAPQPGDLVVEKFRVSAFYETRLDALLRSAGIRSLIVTGIFTNVGVESTVRDAWDRYYDVTVAEDACATPKEPGHEAAITLSLPRFATISTTADVVRKIRDAA